MIGGGDTALEEATYLTRFASKVTVVHRRRELRASKIMQDRAVANPKIAWIWNSEVVEILGSRDEGVRALRLRDRETGAETEFATQGLFVAIGHQPNTQVFAKPAADQPGRLPPGGRADDTHHRPRSLRLRRRHRSDLPPGSDRSRQWLQGGDRRRTLAGGTARMTHQAKTLGELKRTTYRPRTVRAEIRSNLRRKLAAHQELFPGIVGYDRTVIPAIANALLAGHDFILLGLRGQAKSRLLRQLTTLLDPEIPVLAGSEVNDDPLAPISTWGARRIADAGDDAAIEWLAPESRYSEKTATPDVSIADLLGDIDPIKAATRRLTYADPEVIHFGIIPRTNRGIFAINELPDLAPRIQVGLLNLLEERDLQIRGFPVRLALDILFAFSANPEDYTNRGSIITPLRDRIASQILTHYPPSAALAAQITAQEAWTEREDSPIEITEEARLLVEEISIAARESELVDQSSGVSARVAISALELLASNLERRALTTGDRTVFPRLCDLPPLLPALTGKLEMVYEGEQQGPEVVARKLIGMAVKKLFEGRFPEADRDVAAASPDEPGPYSAMLAWFAAGNAVTLSDEMPFADYEAELARVPGLSALAAAQGGTREQLAFWAELVLDGLHQSVKLARHDLDSTVSYKELLKFQLLKPQRRGPRRGTGEIN